MKGFLLKAYSFYWGGTVKIKMCIGSIPIYQNVKGVFTIIFNTQIISGGYTKNVCGCCYVCAKLEGELCGGYWFHFGRCDTNLKCVLRSHGKLINKGLAGYFKPGRCEHGKQ